MSYKQEKESLRSSCTSTLSLCLIHYVDMTEYDYSPEAYERHLATQEKIARWVDQTLEQSPCNPFAPLPSDRSQTPQPAYRATPHGDISPTYSPNHSRRHRDEHNQWHNPSQRSSTSSASLMMQQERPQFGRSVTSPAPQISARQYLPQASNPYPAYPAYPNTPSRAPSPYSSRHSQQHHPRPMPHRAASQASFHSMHSPHIHASPVIQQQHGGNVYPYFSPSHQQPVHQQPQHVVVVRGDRDVTVVPSQGHHIQFLVRFFKNYHVLIVVIHSII